MNQLMIFFIFRLRGNTNWKVVAKLITEEALGDNDDNTDNTDSNDDNADDGEDNDRDTK